MTEPTPSVEPTDDTGLNLFDDRASAAGSFPHTMFGYDRPTVDNYVRDLEQQLATLVAARRSASVDLDQALGGGIAIEASISPDAAAQTTASK